MSGGMNADLRKAVHRLKCEVNALELKLAAHRYALELQNTAVGLPPENEKYDKVAELLHDARACLIEAADDRDALHHGIPWRECPCGDCGRWRKAAGLDTANARDDRP